ncbi:pseudouridine synthase [Pseudanabaena sp. PCC 6802]|uniref:pseudouridine synthase n=1 Tax=Pseudanabaena sp. PCC 6802 TaxID=118173 RepID=UPI000345C352|nr:pseudouridine synthase [Pseudanabaena sp. PCC 6802]
MAERLQKIISRFGIASRREAEQMILASRVRLNGTIVTELGIKADPASDRIEVDGRLINQARSPQKIYLLLNKPVATICTRRDPQGRRTVLDLLPPQYQHLYPVGRLDYNSSGALLLTNDGDFANSLAHPRHHITKTYEVWVRGQIDLEVLQIWQAGVELDGRLTLPCEVTVLTRTSDRTQLQIVLKEGRNRQIRRIAEQLNHPVMALHRVAIAEINLGNLPVGKYRHLTKPEVQQTGWLMG